MIDSRMPMRAGIDRLDEITENTIMNDMDSVIHKLKELSKKGVYIAIDDFGTGYSSLSYLSRFPLDTLKIDRSFVKELPASQTDISLIKIMMLMARELNLEVIAEGVETAAQLAFLRRLQCDQFQGYLFSKPLAADDAGQHIERNYNGQMSLYARLWP